MWIYGSVSCGFTAGIVSPSIGHAGHPENERCDALAVEAGAGAASRGVPLPEDEGYMAQQNGSTIF